jgi:hypothetical protein
MGAMKDWMMEQERLAEEKAPPPDRTLKQRAYRQAKRQRRSIKKITAKPCRNAAPKS